MIDAISPIKTHLGNCRDVLKTHGVTMHGNLFRCIAPDHKDRHASASLFDGDNRFKCHGCGTGGDAINAYALLNGMSNSDAIKTLTRKYGPDSKPVAQRSPLKQTTLRIPELSTGNTRTWKKLAAPN